MKFREIFRFEIAYQVRRVSTWLYAAFLLFVAFVQATAFIADARHGDYFLNAPFVVAEIAIVCCLWWLLVAAYVAGRPGRRRSVPVLDWVPDDNVERVEVER